MYWNKTHNVLEQSTQTIRNTETEQYN
jgi:hypothetical protein